jgi:hypothetical protein
MTVFSQKEACAVFRAYLLQSSDAKAEQIGYFITNDIALFLAVTLFPLLGTCSVRPSVVTPTILTEAFRGFSQSNL